MTKGEIIQKVYEDMLEQATKVLFQELIVEDHAGRHAGAERRYGYALKAAELAKERARVLVNEQKGTE